MGFLKQGEIMPRVEAEKKKILADNPFVWLGLLVAIVVLGTVAYFMTFKETSKVLAVVGDKKIYEKDLNEKIYGLSFEDSIYNPEETDIELKRQLLDELIEYEILESRAVDLAISISNEEVESYAKGVTEGYENLKVSQKLIADKNAKLSLLREAVSNKVLTWSEGKSLVCPFYLHFYGDPTNKTEAERTGLVESDKEYAMEKCQDLYNKLKTGEINFDQAIEEIKNDKVIGNVAWQPYIMKFTSSFTKEDSIERLFPNDAPEFWDKITETSNNTLTEPILLKLKLNNDSVVGKEGELVDSMYLIVQKENGQKGESLNYKDWLKDQWSKYKVKTYL